jgi:hypothetical protein
VLLVPASQLDPCFVAHPTKVGVTSGEDWFLVRAPAALSCAHKGDADRAIRYIRPTGIIIRSPHSQ